MVKSEAELKVAESEKSLARDEQNTVLRFTTSNQVSERQFDESVRKRWHYLSCDSSETFRMPREFSKRSIFGIKIVRNDLACMSTLQRPS